MQTGKRGNEGIKEGGGKGKRREEMRSLPPLDFLSTHTHVLPTPFAFGIKSCSISLTLSLSHSCSSSQRERENRFIPNLRSLLLPLEPFDSAKAREMQLANTRKHIQTECPSLYEYLFPVSPQYVWTGKERARKEAGLRIRGKRDGERERLAHRQNRRSEPRDKCSLMQPPPSPQQRLMLLLLLLWLMHLKGR